MLVAPACQSVLLGASKVSSASVDAVIRSVSTSSADDLLWTNSVSVHRPLGVGQCR